MISFTVGGKCVRFMGPKCLRKFNSIKKWNAGYIEVMADYGDRVEEDYIDLVPIFENLMLSEEILKSIDRVEVKNG